jgi:hypothetical protein
MSLVFGSLALIGIVVLIVLLGAGAIRSHFDDSGAFFN